MSKSDHHDPGSLVDVPYATYSTYESFSCKFNDVDYQSKRTVVFAASFVFVIAQMNDFEGTPRYYVMSPESFGWTRNRFL